MSLLSDILGPLFLLAVGLSAVLGAWSAFMKAKRLYGGGEKETVQDQHNATVAKAVIAGAFAGVIWYDSFDLDTAVVRVAVPIGVYKFVQLMLTPLIGWHLENSAPPIAKEQLKDG